jgi:hypothetical protein
MTLSPIRPFLLILGSMTDPHVERVADEITRRGAIDVRILDFLNGGRFALTMDEYGVYQLRVDGLTIPPHALVWDRAKIIAGTAFYFPDMDENSGYAAEEWRALYRLVCGLAGDRVVNSLTARSCLTKPYQQMHAAQAGFRVPRTLVGNEKRDLENFIDGQPMTIMKSLSATKVRPATEGEFIPYNVLTMRISPDDVAEASIDEIAFCPHFLQDGISKSHELRVVYVDGKCLPFKVDSQRYKTSTIDWRKGLDFIDFYPTKIDHEIEERIRSFMRRMGLFAGSLDLIVREDGEVYFLECNQEGAWGWLDDLDDGRVTLAFADALSGRAARIAGESGLVLQETESVKAAEHSLA